MMTNSLPARWLGRNKVIVSGDKHLLDVSGYQKIEVLKPRKFVTKYLE